MCSTLAFTSLLDKIDRARDTFFGIWRGRMHQAGYVKPVAAKPEAFVNAFDTLLTVLRSAGDEQEALFPEALLVSCAGRHRDRGIPVDLFLGCFKTMIQSLEELVRQFGGTPESTLLHLVQIRQLADRIETAVVRENEEAAKSGRTCRLEENCRRLAIEKLRYKNIYLNTTNLVMISDSKGVVIEANPQTHHVFAGLKVEGRQCAELLELEPASLPAIMQRYPLGNRHEIDIGVDGDHRVFNLNVFPLGKTADPARGVMLVLNDITAMVDARLMLERQVNDQAQAQADSEKILGAIFHSVGEGILLIDEDYEVVRANPQASEIFGLPDQNLNGMDVQSLTDSSGMKTLSRFFQTVIEGEHVHADITGFYVDGRSFPAAVTLTRIDFHGRTFWTMIVRDITEQKEFEKRLQQEKRQTEEINLTLKNVLKTIEADRREREQQIAAKVRTSLLPAMQKIAQTEDLGVRNTYLDLIRSQLVGLTSGFESKLDAGLLKLTRTEIEICRLIQVGLSGKEICDAMNLAFETIQTHRKNIRAKLGLKGKKINLQAYLADRNCEPDTPVRHQDADFASAGIPRTGGIKRQLRP